MTDVLKINVNYYSLWCLPEPPSWKKTETRIANWDCHRRERTERSTKSNTNPPPVGAQAEINTSIECDDRACDSWASTRSTSRRSSCSRSWRTANVWAEVCAGASGAESAGPGWLEPRRTTVAGNAARRTGSGCECALVGEESATATMSPLCTSVCNRYDAICSSK